MYNKKKEKNGIHRILIYRDKRLEIYKGWVVSI